ncbi:7987_t:CDS:2 [Acaulospora morrowiae]|uniref:7987_t:CDS:1 n=1 Tax=Acaulospora morrowiae TaxID=94023 RepID=A0A9N9FNG1_9GLOM|nr:7987_t:CDS:2 [Acaulospora morrowiae]
MTNKSFITVTPKSSPSTNRTKNSRKTRVTHARVQKVKVTTLGRASCVSEKQPFRTCVRCKESSNNVKMLSARVERIEQLVSELANTTANFSKNTTWRFGNIDLKACSLEELQKLVISTTTSMMPPPLKPTITDNFCSEPSELPQFSGVASTKKTASSNLDYTLRKDSGFAETKSSDIEIGIQHNNNATN